MRLFLVISGLLLLGKTLFGQTETDLSREFIYEGRQYVPDSPWWTVGYGYGYNFDEHKAEPDFLLDVHFRLNKKHYYGLGFLTSRSQFLDKSGENIFLPHSFVKNSVNSIHAMYGWRKELLYYNFGAFIGPGLHWGFDYIYSDSTGDYHQGYFEPGIYASLQFTRKAFYDLGIGTTLWVSLNKSYQVMGLTLHFYFSTALKRTLN